MVLWPRRSSELTPVEPSEGYTILTVYSRTGNMQDELWRLFEDKDNATHTQCRGKPVQITGKRRSVRGGRGPDYVA